LLAGKQSAWPSAWHKIGQKPEPTISQKENRRPGSPWTPQNRKFWDDYSSGQKGAPAAAYGLWKKECIV